MNAAPKAGLLDTHKNALNALAGVKVLAEKNADDRVGGFVMERKTFSLGSKISKEELLYNGDKLLKFEDSEIKADEVDFEGAVDRVIAEGAVTYYFTRKSDDK